ncbi:MAG: hypothetical protein J7L66_06550, partial [Anaerolineaceae bacterium]|nr:hypothetical protein [Anaerolineaceae bacterium]
VKKFVVDFGLMPKSMAGKKLLKRIVFGKLTTMPAEITADTTQYTEPTPLSADAPDKKHKVIYCVATIGPQISQIDAEDNSKVKEGIWA